HNGRRARRYCREGHLLSVRITESLFRAGRGHPAVQRERSLVFCRCRIDSITILLDSITILLDSITILLDSITILLDSITILLDHVKQITRYIAGKSIFKSLKPLIKLNFPLGDQGRCIDSVQNTGNKRTGSSTDTILDISLGNAR